MCCSLISKQRASPYRRRGKRGPIVENDEYGIEQEYVMSAKEPEKAIIELNMFVDLDVRDSKATFACEKFEHRMIDLFQEVRERKWATVVLDSVTFLEYAVRKAQQYKFNPTSNKGNKQDDRQWYKESAEGIEEACYALCDLRVNVVATAHVRAEMDKQREFILWTPEAPGKRNRGLPAAFGEVYAMHIDTEAGTFIQAHRDKSYIACTQINAPDGVEPRYKNLWKNYKVEKD